MTDQEAIAEVRAGRRVAGEFSKHAEEKPDAWKTTCPGFNHQWRTLFCDGDTDVVECIRCGRQELCRCNFDDECA